MEKTKLKRESAADVLLFVPNIIGYTRVIMTLIAYWFMLPGDEIVIFGLCGWHLCLICYSVSFIADAVDGIAVLKEIKRLNKALPVVMLSSQESYTTASQTIMYGAMHYVIKGESAFEEISDFIKANV